MGNWPGIWHGTCWGISRSAQTRCAAPKMTCRETIRLICEYLDGRLSPIVVRDLRRHLEDCNDCRMVLDAARSTLETYFGQEPESLLEPKTKVASTVAH